MQKSIHIRTARKGNSSEIGSDAIIVETRHVDTVGFVSKRYIQINWGIIVSFSSYRPLSKPAGILLSSKTIFSFSSYRSYM